MKLELALQIMDKCAEQAAFSVPKQAMVTIRKELEAVKKPADNEERDDICPSCGGDGSFLKPYDLCCKGIVVKCQGKRSPIS